jgi:hypothetical protein
VKRKGSESEKVREEKRREKEEREGKCIGSIAESDDSPLRSDPHLGSIHSRCATTIRRARRISCLPSGHGLGSLKRGTRQDRSPKTPRRRFAFVIRMTRYRWLTTRVWDGPRFLKRTTSMSSEAAVGGFLPLRNLGG